MSHRRFFHGPARTPRAPPAVGRAAWCVGPGIGPGLGLALLAAGAASAQSHPVTFTSAYTDLSRECHPVGTRRERQEAADHGEDTPLACPGPGGQMVFVSFGVWSATLFVGPRGPLDGRQRQLPEQAFDFVDTPGRRLEWRLADGRPFAAILRVVDYRTPPNTDQQPFAARYAHGASLVAVGLPGFERIDLRLPAARADANAAIRQQVDALYAPR